MKAVSAQKWSPLSAWGSRGASSGDEVLLQFFTAFRLRRHKVTTDQSALWPAAHGAPARSAEALEYSPLPLAQGVPSPGIGRKEWAKAPHRPHLLVQHQLKRFSSLPTEPSRLSQDKWQSGNAKCEG